MSQKIDKTQKLNKYDEVCYICGKVIKGFYRESVSPTDYMGISGEDEIGPHHGSCKFESVAKTEKELKINED